MACVQEMACDQAKYLDPWVWMGEAMLYRQSQNGTGHPVNAMIHPTQLAQRPNREEHGAKYLRRIHPCADLPA